MSATDEDIKQLLNQGLGVKKIIDKLHVGQSRVQRIKDELGMRGQKKGYAGPTHIPQHRKQSDISTDIPKKVEYIRPDISEKVPDISADAPPKCNSCVYANVEGGHANYCDKHEPMILRCPDYVKRESEPAAKPEGRLDRNPIFPLDGIPSQDSTPFSGASAGQFVDFTPEITYEDKVIAWYTIEKLLKRSKRAIGYANQEGLEIALKILAKVKE